VHRNLSLRLAAVCCGWLVFCAGALAAPYSVSYTSTTTTFSTLPVGVNLGEQFTITFVLDNGGATAASQSWSADNVQCAIFVFNNAQNEFTAVNYAGRPFTTTTTGNFTTDAGGALQAGTFEWEDLSDPITNPSATNIAGTSVYSWYLNGINDVLFWNSGGSLSAGFASVVPDVQVASWTNPVPAGGTCARFLGTPVAQKVPGLSAWALALLSGLLGLSALFAFQRRRR
jgi:hypothetical protein